MIKYKEEKVIEVQVWNKFVEKTYGRTYSLQQQNGCMERQRIKIDVPSYYINDDEMNDSIPEVVNGNEMGVKFDVWLNRDPKQPIPNQTQDCELKLFWERNFYPDLDTIINDLYKKGLINEGKYTINIDW